MKRNLMAFIMILGLAVCSLSVANAQEKNSSDTCIVDVTVKEANIRFEKGESDRIETEYYGKASGWQWAYVQWSCPEMSDEAKTRLTIEKVMELAEKGNTLTWGDFEQFEDSGDIGSGLYIIRYDLEEPYYVLVGGADLGEEPMYIRLVSTQNPDDYIDIRMESIEDFLNGQPVT